MHNLKLEILGRHRLAVGLCPRRRLAHVAASGGNERDQVEREKRMGDRWGRYFTSNQSGDDTRRATVSDGGQRWNANHKMDDEN
jgi:hypothetical protein